MEIAQKMREARSQHLLHSSEKAVKQLRVFKEATPITQKKSKFSGNLLKRKGSSCPKRRQS